MNIVPRLRFPVGLQARGPSVRLRFQPGLKGNKGDQGDQGLSGTITDATASALDAGEPPTVTLGGTPQNRTMQFGIPQGEKGDQGIPGVTDLVTPSDPGLMSPSLLSSLNGKADGTVEIVGDGLATGGGSLAADRTITVPAADQPEAEAGSVNDKAMTPLRTVQAIDAKVVFSGTMANAVTKPWVQKERENWSTADVGVSVSNSSAINASRLQTLLGELGPGGTLDVLPGNFPLEPIALTGLNSLKLVGKGTVFSSQFILDGDGVLIDLIGSTNIQFRNIGLHTSPELSVSEGLRADGASNFHLYESIIYGFKGPGIRLNGSPTVMGSGTIIRDAILLSNGLDGNAGQLQGYHHNDFSITGTQFGAFLPITNELTQRPGRGVLLDNCNNGYLGDNLVWQGKEGGLFQNCKYNRVIANRFEESRQAGLRYYSCSDFISIGNWINDNSTSVVGGYDAWEINAVIDSTFEGNVVFNWAHPTRQHRYSYAVTGGSTGNIFTGNKTKHANGAHLYLSADSSGNEFDGSASFSASSAVGPGSTVYVGPAGESSNITSLMVCGGRRCVSGLDLKLSNAPGSGETITATLIVDGVATGLACAVSGGNFSARGIGAVEVPAGAGINVRLVSSAGAASTMPRILVEAMKI